MTDDGAFRVVVARTTDTVQGALSAQAAFGQSGRYLGELITAAVLVRETMAPRYRVQSLLRTGDGRGRLVADAHPDGGNRGLLTRTGGLEEIEVCGGTLEVLRTLYNGELHRGVVHVPDAGGISKALMGYMASSEQVVSMVAVGCVLDGDNVLAAGGYMVQLLPEVDRGPLAIMTERLRDFERIEGLLVEQGGEPGPLLEELLFGMPYTRLEQSTLEFKCRCDAVRVMSALASLGRAELSDLLRDARVLELSCDYCGHAYTVTPEQVKGLLDRS
jgi:molecular chaperone Hsp33